MSYELKVTVDENDYLLCKDTINDKMFFESLNADILNALYDKAKADYENIDVEKAYYYYQNLSCMKGFTVKKITDAKANKYLKNLYSKEELGDAVKNAANKDKIKGLCKIVNLCGENTSNWFNSFVENAAKEAFDEENYFGKADSYIHVGTLGTYLWYRLCFHFANNPISLSVLFDYKENDEDKDSPLFQVCIELHEEASKKQHIPAFYNERINKLVDIVNTSKEQFSKKTNLRYFVAGDAGERVYKSVDLNVGISDELNNENQRLRLSCFIDVVDGNKFLDNEKVHVQIVDALSFLKNACIEVSKSTVIEKEIYQAVFARDKKQIVIHGAPGTGKTHGVIEFINNMTEGNNDRHNNPIQFHPSYDYTDFVEGIRPISPKGKDMSFVKLDGSFKGFCRKIVNATLLNMIDTIKASMKPDGGGELEGVLNYDSFVEAFSQFCKYKEVDINASALIQYFNEESAKLNANCLYEFLEMIYYISQKTDDDISDEDIIILNSFNSVEGENEKIFYFIIDEINRADISKVFGELMYGLEYRGIKNRFETQYSQLKVVYEEKDE